MDNVLLNSVRVWFIFIVILFSTPYSWAMESLSDGETYIRKVEDHNITLSPQHLDLAKSIDLSLKTNPELKSWEYEQKKSENDKKIARSNFGPSLSLSLNHNDLISIDSKGPADTDYLDQNIDSLDMAVVQPLFKGFTTINEYNRAELLQNWTKWKIAYVKLGVVHEVQTNFLKLLQLMEEVNSLQQTVKRLENALEAAKSFHRVNMAPYIQVLEASVDLSDAKQRLSQAKSSLRTQTIKMNVLAGLSPDAPTVYEGELDTGLAEFPLSMSECLAHAFLNRPDLFAAQVNQHIAEKDIEIIAGRYYPTVQLEGHYSIYDRDYDDLGKDSLGGAYNRDQKNKYWAIVLNMRWNLFESGKTYYTQSKSRNEVSRQKELIRSLKDQIKYNIRTYFLILQESRGRIDSTRKAVTAAKENYQMARKRYQLQLAPNQEVLNAQERLSRSEANLNQALADYKLSLANLYISMGIRNDSLLPTVSDTSNE